MFSAAHSCHVYLKDPNDKALEKKVLGLLKQYGEKGEIGIERILTKAEAKKEYHVTCDFTFIIEPTDGIAFSNKLTRNLVISADNSDYKYSVATHGHMPEKGPQPTFYVCGPNVKKGKNKMDLAEQLRADMREFKKTSGASRLVTIWCGSTETFIEQTAAHQSLKSFEKALTQNDEMIAPSMIYAYASLMEGVPFANGAPNLTVDLPVMQELSRENSAPICGKDYKTGQTLIKTILAPGFKARMIGLNGWFSTNILGNRDGEVLEDPGSFKTKEESKLSVLEHILQPELYPELYGKFTHKVRINYYPPRGDNKEGWDNIDIFGWLGYPMQIKVDFLCRDSILAAPLVLDLVLFLDLAQRSKQLRGLGIQEWLSFYFKSPMSAPGLYPEHDLFIQLMKLKNTLRHLKGEELITHLGLEYY
jgi:myo-inositol-1-phosphate synthase